jgi:hypothetical protein
MKKGWLISWMLLAALLVLGQGRNSAQRETLINRRRETRSVITRLGLPK